MNNITIAFIGGGNMAVSLIGGLIADGVKAEQLHIVEPEPNRRDSLVNRFSVKTYDDIGALAISPDVVMLATKPQHIHTVCSQLAAYNFTAPPLYISIAAGIAATDIDRWLGGNQAIVRTMPNTPALIQTGATALIANKKVSSVQKESAEAILRAVGLTLWLQNEQDLDSVTALSGSGPAYFFLLIELLQQSGESLGLTAESARLLALQTAFGAAKMALESDDDCATLRKKVTSPGGTTEAAVNSMMNDKIDEIIHRAVTGARDRARELAQEFGKL